MRVHEASGDEKGWDGGRQKDVSHGTARREKADFSSLTPSPLSSVLLFLFLFFSFVYFLFSFCAVDK